MNSKSTYQDKLQNTKKLAVTFLSGGIAGALSHTIAAPLERIKIILQTSYKTTQKQEGFYSCLKTILKNEGFLSLWKGNSVNIYKQVPAQSINYLIKETVNSWFNIKNARENKIKFIFSQIFAGGIAGCTSLFILYPFEFARTRLAQDLKTSSKSQAQYSGFYDCIKKISHQRGFLSIYQGISLSLIGIFLYRGLFFGTYDISKKFLLTEEDKNSFTKQFALSQFASAFSSFMTYPIDTLRRQVIYQVGSTDKINVREATIAIYKEKRLRGLYKGFGSALVNSVGGSLILVLFDQIQARLSYLHKPKI